MQRTIVVQEGMQDNHGYNDLHDLNEQTGLPQNEQIYDTRDMNPITRQEYQEHVALMHEHKRRPWQPSWEASTANVTSRIVDYFGEYKAVPETDPNEVSKYVDDYVGSILQQVQARDLRFHGTLKNSGVFRESGLQINRPNEFIYILELSRNNVDVSDMIVAYANMKSSNHRRTETIFGRSYFSLSFKDTVPKHWASKGARQGPQSPADLNLNPHKLLEDFRSTVESVTMASEAHHVTARGADLMLYAKLPKDVAKGFITKHGLFKLRQHDYTDEFLIKISISLGIPVDRNIPTTYWPLQGYGDRQLDLQIAKQNMLINKCHLIADGGLWRVDFSRWQNHRIHQLTENRGRRGCYHALMNISNHLGLPDSYADHLLKRNPLKLAFLKENAEFKDDKDWRPSSISDRVTNILYEVEHGIVQTRTATRSVDEVEHEKSENSAKKIREYVEAVSRQYHTNGSLHFVLSMCIFLCSIILFLMSVAYLSDSSIWEDLTCMCRPPLTFMPYALSNLVLCFLGLVFCAVGAVWIVVQRFVHRPLGVLYDIFRGLLYVYIVMGLVSFLLLVFGIGVVHRFQEVVSCNNRHSEDIQGLVATTAAFSGLCSVAFIVHFIIFFVQTRCDLKRYSWEIVFFDRLYYDLMPCINRRKIDLPRVSVLVNETDRAMSSSTDYSEYHMDQDDDDEWGTGRRKPMSNGGDQIAASSPATDKYWPNTRMSRQASESQLPAEPLQQSRQLPSEQPKYYSLQREVQRDRPRDVPDSTQVYQTNTLPRTPYEPPYLKSITPKRSATLPRSSSRQPMNTFDREPQTPRSPDDVFLPNPTPNTAIPQSDLILGVTPRNGNVQQMDRTPNARHSTGSYMWLPELELMRLRQAQSNQAIQDYHI